MESSSLYCYHLSHSVSLKLAFLTPTNHPNHKLYTYPNTGKNQTPFNIIHPSKLPFTLPETNIAPENGWLEDYFPFGKPSFQVLR